MNKSIKYKWNEEIQNYCVIKGNDFIIPLEAIKLSEVGKADLAESLQMIHYQKTGRIDYGIGLNHDSDVKLAKKMKCWD